MYVYMWPPFLYDPLESPVSANQRFRLPLTATFQPLVFRDGLRCVNWYPPNSSTFGDSSCAMRGSARANNETVTIPIARICSLLKLCWLIRTRQTRNA